MIDTYKESWEIASAIALGEYDIVEGSDAIISLVSRVAGEVAHRLNPPEITEEAEDEAVYCPNCGVVAVPGTCCAESEVSRSGDRT